MINKIIILLILRVFFISASVVAFGHRLYTSFDNTRLWNFTVMDNLKLDLLRRYDKNTRPSQHNESTVVDLNMRVFHIEVDEFRSLITTHAWMTMDWQDTKLKWKKENYENISTVHMSDGEIWKPDISIYNSANGNNYIDDYRKSGCVVKSDGNVSWFPSVRIKSFCDLDLSSWPYDKHNCTLEIGSWIYDGNHINLTANEKPSEETFVDQGEWKIVCREAKAQTTFYACCSEPYIDVQFKICIERRSSSYVKLVYGPLFFICSLIVISFSLSSNNMQKFILNGIIGLLCCAMVILFSNILPNLGSRTPRIFQFYYYTIYWITFSSIILLALSNLSKQMKHSPFPHSVKNNIIYFKLSTLLYGKFINEQRNSDEMQEIIDTASNSNNDKVKLMLHTSDWEIFVKMMDSLFLVIFGIYLMIWGILLVC